MIALVFLTRLFHSAIRALLPPIAATRTTPRLERYLEQSRDCVFGDVGPAPPSVDAPLRYERVAAGRNTVVLRVRLGEKPDVFYARAWRYDRTVRPAREHRVVGQLFAERGLAVPELTWLDERWATAWRWRIEVAVERTAPGRPLGSIFQDSGKDLSLALIERIACDLARLHAKVAADWGKPWRPVNKMTDPLAWWLERLRKLDARIPTGVRILNADRVRSALAELAESVRGVRWERPVLVHGDLSPAHLFVDTDGHLTWIDFGTAQYGHPAMDLAAVGEWPGAEGWFERFLSAYGRAGGEVGEEMRYVIDRFMRLRLWMRLSSRITRRRRLADRLSPKRDRLLLNEQQAIERRIQVLRSPE